MALITKENIKTELGIDDAEQNDLVEAITVGVLGLLDELTGRTWLKTAFTEYYDSREQTNTIFLNSFPVVSSPAVQVWDDPDWAWDSTSLIPAADYRVDYVNGIIHYNSTFHIGKQSVKVAYTAGYASLPAGVKQILVRQGAHWFSQAKDSKWDKASIAQPSGMGTTSYKNLMDNLLPDFAMLVERESR